ncbi:hypothetical protein [Streptomyces sp. NPDC020983]|uniref:hypothetical protein n=1 Tax=Streptomyces sp. NPDC020983 TaxID=3365106 RepID=UPI0037B3D27C
MPTKQQQAEAKARAESDAATANSAVHLYFDHLAAEAQAALDKAAADLAAANERRREWTEGDRLSRDEAMLVYGHAITRTTELAQKLISGKPGVTHEEYDRAKADTEATFRGLVAEGYDIPDTSAPRPRERR